MAERGEIDAYLEARKITFDVAAECLVGFQTGAQVDHLRDLFYQIMFASMTDTFTSEQDFLRQDDRRPRRVEWHTAGDGRRAARGPDDILGLLVAARGATVSRSPTGNCSAGLHPACSPGHGRRRPSSAWLVCLPAAPRCGAAGEEIRDALATTNGEVTLDALRAMPALGRAVDETGRLRSPVGNVPRGVVKDFAFGGYHVPVGTRVLLSLVACHS